MAQSTTADTLFAKGEELSTKGNYSQAENYYSEARSLYLQNGDSLGWFKASLEYGENHISLGKVRAGLDLFLKLDSIRIKNTPIHLKGRIKNDIGLAYRNLENYALAKQYYKDALSIAYQINDTLQIGRINSNISYAYTNLENYEQAISHQQIAQRIFEETGDTYRLSNVLNATFLTLMELGLYEKAQPYIKESLELRKKLDNPRLMDIAYHNLAWSFEKLGKRDSAIIYYQKSLEITRQLNNPYEITQTLENIGGIYEQSGDLENALAYYNEALAINQEINRPLSTVESLIRVARIAVINEDIQVATEFYNEALDLLNNTPDPGLLSSIYFDLANIEIRKENYNKAKNYIESAQEITKEFELTSRLIETHSILGKIYFSTGDKEAGLQEYKKAHFASSSATINEQISSATQLAQAYHEVSSDSAFVIAEEAFALIDSIRTNVAGLAFRSGFFREHAGFYNEVASWYITQKDEPEMAFKLVEAAKSRVLMDELAEVQEKVYTTLDESTLIKKQQKAKKIDRLYSDLKESRSEQEAQAIQKELKDLEFEYQSFLNEIHSTNSRLKNFSYPEPISLSQFQQTLDDESAVLEYTFTRDGLLQLVITKDDISASYQEGLNKESASLYYSETVRSFRSAITQKQSASKVNALGKELHSSLIPLFDVLSDQAIENLIIIPDGPLSFLPFEALHTGSNYLIEDYFIKYLPSASIYPFIEAPHRTTEYDLLAVAGSGFESRENIANPTRSQSSFASLPSTLLEVDSIAVNFEKTTLLKNEDVTEANLKSHEMGNYRFLHFATHADVDEVTPSRSGLLLSKKQDVESLFGEDGHLNSREISNLELNADLVTLSACNTGMGKQVTGEGLLGLQRSFLSAGTSSVMVSLWPVFDRSTSIFMSGFYSSLLAHQESDYGLWSKTLDWFGFYEHPMIDYKTKAIHEAKIAMINHPYYNHPVYWAPFILIGK